MTAGDQENMPRRWPLSIEALLEGMGQVIASVSVMSVIMGILLFWDSADHIKPRAWGMLIGGVYGLGSGFVMWGLATVIKELRRIRTVLEDRHEGRP